MNVAARFTRMHGAACNTHELPVTLMHCSLVSSGLATDVSRSAAECKLGEQPQMCKAFGGTAWQTTPSIRFGERVLSSECCSAQHARMAEGSVAEYVCSVCEDQVHSRLVNDPALWNLPSLIDS